MGASFWLIERGTAARSMPEWRAAAVIGWRRIGKKGSTMTVSPSAAEYGLKIWLAGPERPTSLDLP